MRVAARQHDDALAAPRRDVGEGRRQRAPPGQALRLALGHERQMARAPDERLGAGDECARRRRQHAGPSSPMPMTASQAAHPSAPPASALTAAAASALPPRRPSSAMNGTANGFCGERRLGLGRADEADGKSQHERRPVGAPAAIISRRWNSAVGALPMATTAPREMRPPQLDRRRRARRAEAPAEVRHGRIGDRRDHAVAGAQPRMVMPAATIAASTSITAPARERRPARRRRARRCDQDRR